MESTLLMFEISDGLGGGTSKSRKSASILGQIIGATDATYSQSMG